MDECAGQVPELLPEEVRLAHSLAQVEFSCRNIHFPESWEALEIARRRLIFEEFFLLSCGMSLLRTGRDRGAGPGGGEAGFGAVFVPAALLLYRRPAPHRGRGGGRYGLGPGP